MNKRTCILGFIYVTIIALIPVNAVAYVGPGAGLGAIGTVLALIGAVLLGIVGFVWYPVKRLLNSRKTRNQHEDDNSPGDVESTVESVEAEHRD